MVQWFSSMFKLASKSRFGEFRNLWEGRIGFCTLKAVFHPKGWIASWREKKFIPRAEGPRDEFFHPWRMQFIPRDEINSLKGATTQFFLTIGYENAFHSEILFDIIFRQNVRICIAFIWFHWNTLISRNFLLNIEIFSISEWNAFS